MNIQQFVSEHTTTILTILGILAGAWLFTRFSGVLVRRAIKRSVRSHHYKSQLEEKKREHTITQLLTNVIRIAVWPIALTIVVAQLGVNIGPLIAGAGIVGLAVGFGAQSLVKDIISGLFIIAENQYGVGDVVDLSGVSGLVEDISLRKTTLRDLDGIVHHIPNGMITQASNYTSEFSGINLNVNVGYDSDLDKVIKVVNIVGAELAADQAWKADIIEAPSFLRVDNFGENAIEVKIVGKTKPLKQWDVTGELRKRLKVAFDKADITIPLPQRVIYSSKI